MNQQMNNTQIITILVSVVLLLFLHYTHSSCEYFGVGSHTLANGLSQKAESSTASSTINYYTVTPVQFKVTNELMQQLLMKLSDFVYKYSNKMYSDQTMINNRNIMKEMMTKVQKITLKDLLQMDSNQVNAMISYISSF